MGGRVSAIESMLVLGLAPLLAAGCTAVGDPPALPDGGAQPDAEVVLPDASVVADAAPMPVTLSHSSSTDIKPQNSVACNQQQDDGTGTLVPVYHTENSFYRVFDLAAEGVERDLVVEQVSFGVESATGGADATQPISVKLSTLSGQFVVANLTELATVDLDVPDQSATTIDVPIEATVPADATLVVEIAMGDGAPDNLFFIGTNDAGETAPTYLRAPDCDDDGDSTNGTLLAEPLDLDRLDLKNVQAVIQVSGSY